MINLKSVFFVFGVTAAVVSPAAIVVTPGPGNFPGDENILFNTGGLINDGPLVQGISNQTNFLFNYFDAGEDLHVDGGQARINSLNDDGYQALTFEFDQDDVAFLTYIVNMNVLNAAGDGFVTWYGTTFGGSEVNLGTFDLSATGENWFRFSTTGGDYIDQLRFTTTVDIQDIRQNRVGGVQVVPEPASMAALAIGFGAIASRIRRRKK
jgi:hypothetical protein